MNDEPDIVKLLMGESNLDILQGQSQSDCEELQVLKSSPDKPPNEATYDFEVPATGKGEDADLGTVEEKYRTIFENYAIAITLADDKERIVSWNTYAEELLGMDERELFMKSVSELYPPEEWKRIREENVRKKGIKYQMETKMIRKGEKPFDVEISLCVLRGEKGKTVGSIGIIKDITTQKEMERALEKSEKKFKQLYEKAPVPYHTLSPSGVITDVNETWCQILGYTKEEVLGKSIFDFVDEIERYVAQSSFDEKLKSKQSYIKGHERTYLTKGGDKRIFVIRDFFSFDNNNDVNAVYTIMDDITELKKVEGELSKSKKDLEKVVELKTNAEEEVRKLNENLEQKVKERTNEVRKLLKQKDEFINQLGHYLKSPLTPLVGLLPILKNKVNDEELKFIVDACLRSTDHMKNLVFKTLQLAKLNSSEFILNIENLNLLSEVNDSVGNNQFLFNENNVKIENNINKDIFIQADKIQLKEVFDNLFSNAVKYLSENNKKIIIDAKTETNGNILISVKDNGKGMTSEQMKYVFDEFYKVDPSRHDLNSSGLGLTICKRIVEHHGGRIWFESPGPEECSTVFFTIPPNSK